MNYLRIQGPTKLSGTVTISGAKNAALPLITLTLLGHNPITMSNVPEVADIKTLLKLLSNLGASYTLENHVLKIDTSTVNNTMANYDIVKTMRASILVLGPLLARFGHCEVSLPGGCAIGQRPIDLHLKAMEAMGATITIHAGYVHAVAPKGLKGAHIIFDKITVTGTANVVMAAALAHGKSVLVNCAKEPEVVQLCEILRNSGIDITGIGTSELTIVGTGGKTIDMVDFEVIPDRIEAGTYMCAAAITDSIVTLERVRPDHLDAVTAKLEQMGCRVECSENTMTVYPATELKHVNIVTQEYPAFPTDMQAQFMALAIRAKGASTIDERLFENRFMHVSELQRLGANIKLSGHVATVIGPCELAGADVMATDLRASSALVLAAMAAEGTTNVHRIYHLDRGYENLEEKLRTLGAQIERLQE
ncbi:UDP-N-acetylglucosamine 1-carboxyvinyltransferase [Sulfuricurvum sp.]|uniref:UDP-N-acetylglucosamine 1-carboxyvinyltransferase n=1 Tax=Sulfuricurvum sp. TaxID=2025608 RepID=UPI0019B01348|nr:UDP-N-acetylglucosamine 1-carboxyvinyltransferase [Sulfuricurvum sp.]MBD3806627.1 UDP-N-acetylglucosamine 1-carboxyvinyltransferase [Sulfuricurvum sp.]